MEQLRAGTAAVAAGCDRTHGAWGRGWPGLRSRLRTRPPRHAPLSRPPAPPRVLIVHPETLGGIHGGSELEGIQPGHVAAPGELEPDAPDIRPAPRQDPLREPLEVSIIVRVPVGEAGGVVRIRAPTVEADLVWDHGATLLVHPQVPWIGEPVDVEAPVGLVGREVTRQRAGGRDRRRHALSRPDGVKREIVGDD